MAQGDGGGRATVTGEPSSARGPTGKPLVQLQAIPVSLLASLASFARVGRAMSRWSKGNAIN